MSFEGCLEFKFRYANHKSTFKNENHKQSTTISSYYWDLKRQNKNPKVTFSIMRIVKSFTPETRVCGLCTAEKLAILKADPRIIVNTRSELLSRCRHKRRFLLESITWYNHECSSQASSGQLTQFQLIFMYFLLIWNFHSTLTRILGRSAPHIPRYSPEPHFHP